jgi:mRNA interferase MazF
MTKCDVGDVVLVRYPFTDLTSTKKRPAVILSPSDYAGRFGDVVVVPLTSRAEQDSRSRSLNGAPPVCANRPGSNRSSELYQYD